MYLVIDIGGTFVKYALMDAAAISDFCYCATMKINFCNSGKMAMQRRRSSFIF